MKKDKDKRVKKCIVNGLTGSRVVATFMMPILFNILSAPVFLLVVAVVLFTDFLDGKLARKWDVSTIFGSYADMTADKLFGAAVLLVLGGIYPLMYIPLVMEGVIAYINSKAVSHGAIGKSSQIGRIKTWVMGVSMCLLLLTGMAPELISNLSNIKVIDVSNSFLSNLGGVGENIAQYINSILTSLKSGTEEVLKNIDLNKDIISPIAQTSIITSEGLVTTDYLIKSIKETDKDSKAFKWSQLIKNKMYRDHIKKILFDEKYYKETQDMSLIEKITPPELREDNVKMKKLTKDNK